MSLGTATEVQERITDADAIAVDAITAASNASEILEDIGGIQPSVFTVTAPESLAPFSPTLTDTPTRPSASRVTSAMTALDRIDNSIAGLSELNANADKDFAAFTTTYNEVAQEISALKSQLYEITTPQASDFLFTEGNYREDNSIDAKVKSIIEDEIARGGEGYSDETETAMFELDIERRELARQEEVDSAIESTEGQGFSMPQGFHYEAVPRVNEKYRRAEEEESRKVMLLQSKLSQENKWIAINNGISYNQILIAFYDAKAQRGLEAAIAVLGLALIGMRYRAEFLMKELAANKSLNAADMDAVRIAIERYALTLTKFQKRVQGLTVKARGYTQKYGASARVHGADVAAAADQSRLTQAENKLTLEMQKIDREGYIAAATQTVKSFMSATQTRLATATNRAKLQGSLAAATISSLGAVVQRTDAGETMTSE